jgi:imidazolonepropionase-like amidohydrolase
MRTLCRNFSKTDPTSSLRLAPLRVAAAALLFGLAVSVHAQTVYHGFTLLDPSEQRVVENAYIVVDGARIAEVGHGAAPQGDGLLHIDMSGLYAMPGLIDAHAHVTFGVRSMDMSGGMPVLRETPSDSITRFNALVALASGVTTIRNPAGVPEAGARYADKVRSGVWAGPEVQQAGSLIGGYPLDWAVQPEDEAEWQDAIAREGRFGFELVKLYTGLSESELKQGIEAVRAHGLRTIAHLDRVSWTRAAELGIDALTHALPTSEDLLVEPARSAYLETRNLPSAKFMYQWFEFVDFDSEPMREMFGVLAEKQVLVDLTLVVNEIVYWFDDIDSRPFMPEHGWMHPDLVALWREQLGLSLYDWTADDFERAKSIMPKVLEFARRLHEAGVPVVIGTDGSGGGPLLARELQLHVDAGIPIWDVLALVTATAAERLGLHETGRLASGYRADIVFLEANPLDDITHVGRVEAVVAGGRAYRARDLMTQARSLAE